MGDPTGLQIRSIWAPLARAGLEDVGGWRGGEPVLPGTRVQTPRRALFRLIPSDPAAEHLVLIRLALVPGLAGACQPVPTFPESKESEAGKETITQQCE